MVARGQMLSIEDILDILAVELIAVIPEDEDILIASNQGQPVVAMASINGSNAGRAFHNLAHRLEGEDIPLIDLTPKGGFMNRLRDWVAGA